MCVCVCVCVLVLTGEDEADDGEDAPGSQRSHVEDEERLGDDGDEVGDEGDADGGQCRLDPL